MKLQREDIHPLQDTCPYFRSYRINLMGMDRNSGKDFSPPTSLE